MKIHNIFLIALIISLTSGCALTGGSKPNYGAKVIKPAETNYSNPIQVTVKPPVPESNTERPETPLEDLTKAFYTPYSTLYTACLSALENMNLSLKSFNSTSGIIEFKTLQGQTLVIQVSPDKEYNSRSSVKLFAQDGSRRFNVNFINTLFESINYQINSKY